MRTLGSLCPSAQEGFKVKLKISPKWPWTQGFSLDKALHAPVQKVKYKMLRNAIWVRVIWLNGWARREQRSQLTAQKEHRWDKLHWIRSPSATQLPTKATAAMLLGTFSKINRSAGPEKRAWQLSWVIHRGGRAFFFKQLLHLALTGVFFFGWRGV